MKKAIVCLLIIMSCFLLTGCDSRPHVGKVYYKTFDNITETKEDSGKLESGNEWESIRYVSKGVVLTVTKYKDRDISLGIAKTQGIEKKTINDRDYYYKTTDYGEDIILVQYYTQVGKDTYLFAFTYKNTKDNLKTIDEVLESIEVKK